MGIVTRSMKMYESTTTEHRKIKLYFSREILKHLPSRLPLHEDVENKRTFSETKGK